MRLHSNKDGLEDCQQIKLNDQPVVNHKEDDLNGRSYEALHLDEDRKIESE